MEPSLDHQVIFQHTLPTSNTLLQHVSHASLQPTGISSYSIVAIFFVVPGIQRLGEQLQPGRGRIDRQQLHDSQRGVYFQATLQQGDTPDGTSYPNTDKVIHECILLVLKRLTLMVVGVVGLDERDPHPILQLPGLGRYPERSGLPTGHRDGSAPRASEEVVGRSQREHPL